MKERYKLFTNLITKINRSIYSIKRDSMAEYNLKSAHVSCLLFLYEQAGLTAKAICDISGEDKAAISRSLSFLEARGFLIVDSTSIKKYKSPIYLTEQGKTIAKQIEAKIMLILEEVNSGIDEESRKIFYNTLLLLNNNLERICEKTKINN